MSKKGKSGKLKKGVVIVAAVMACAIAGGTVARVVRNEKDETKQEQEMPVEWELGLFYPETGVEREYETGGMPITYRTVDMLPYNEFNLSWDNELSLSNLAILFYDEEEQYLNMLYLQSGGLTADMTEFLWEDRATYQFADGSSIPDAAAYVHVWVMGVSSDQTLDTDKITISYKK